MKSIMQKLALLFFVAFMVLSCTDTYTKEEIGMMFEQVTSRYGIKIVYEIGKDFGPIHIGGGRTCFNKSEPIEHRVLARYPHLLKLAFEKYPVSVIKEYLAAIYFAKELELDGLQYGGTYDPFRRIVYLVNDGKQNDDQSISAFHHEFSSLLLKRHTFFLNPWLDQNPKNFKYKHEIKDDEKDVLYTGVISGTTADYDKGFMNTYAQTTFENDFNEYSNIIFTQPKEFKKIMNKYPRVRGKFLVWLDFYHKIDPIFTEAYFLGKS